MAKILLINPVVREEDQPKHIPYGLSFLAAIALTKGHQVQFYDENAWRKGEKVIRQVIAADDWEDRKSTRLNSSHSAKSRMPSSA